MILFSLLLVGLAHGIERKTFNTPPTGHGWIACYGSNSDVHVASLRTFGTVGANNNWQRPCQGIRFNQVLFNLGNQLAWFERIDGMTTTIMAARNRASRLNGQWRPKGVAIHKAGSYQMQVCDTGTNWPSQGIMFSAWTGCWKGCGNWCGDTSPSYYRHSGQHGAFAGVCFNENGHRNCGNKLMHVYIRDSKNIGPPTTPKPSEKFNFVGVEKDWVACYTTDSDIHLKQMTKKVGGAGYQGFMNPECLDMDFNEIMYYKHVGNQKAIFVRENKADTMIARSMNQLGSFNGYWLPGGGVAKPGKYQLVVCDSGVHFSQGLMISGKSSCFKKCDNWCGDTSGYYYRAAAQHNAFNGFAFGENGHKTVSKKLVTVFIRHTPNVTPKPTPIPQYNFEGVEKDWVACYTTDSDIHLKAMTKKVGGAGYNGFMNPECLNADFNQVMFYKHVGKQKAIFTRENKMKMTINGNMNKNGKENGYWLPGGGVAKPGRYQLLVCDSGNTFSQGLMISGKSSCFKACNSWCGDTSGYYYRASAQHGHYAGFAFSENGHRTVSKKLVTVFIRYVPNTPEPTPNPTRQPTPMPTKKPTPMPTKKPTPVPTDKPTTVPPTIRTRCGRQGSAKLARIGSKKLGKSKLKKGDETSCDCEDLCEGKGATFFSFKKGKIVVKKDKIKNGKVVKKGKTKVKPGKCECLSGTVDSFAHKANTAPDKNKAWVGGVALDNFCNKAENKKDCPDEKN